MKVKKIIKKKKTYKYYRMVKIQEFSDILLKYE